MPSRVDKRIFAGLGLLASGVLAGCGAAPEPPIIEGGPTYKAAIAAVLANPHIIRPQASTVDLNKVRLETTRCAHQPHGAVNCHIRLYSLGRGWSAVTPGRFIKTGGTWIFEF